MKYLSRKKSCLYYWRYRKIIIQFFCREIGSDIARGTTVVLKKSVLNATEIGVLAAVGKTNVHVYK